MDFKNSLKFNNSPVISRYFNHYLHLIIFSNFQIIGDNGMAVTECQIEL